MSGGKCLSGGTTFSEEISALCPRFVIVAGLICPETRRGGGLLSPEFGEVATGGRGMCTSWAGSRSIDRCVPGSEACAGELGGG